MRRPISTRDSALVVLFPLAPLQEKCRANRESNSRQPTNDTADNRSNCRGFLWGKANNVVVACWLFTVLDGLIVNTDIPLSAMALACAALNLWPAHVVATLKTVITMTSEDSKALTIHGRPVWDGSTLQGNVGGGEASIRSNWINDSPE